MRLKYEIDPHNRLVAQRTGGKTRVGYFRQVLDGTFKAAEGNSLSYHVKRSSGRDVPQEIRFSGKWSLDKKRGLVFTLDKWNNQVEGDKLVVKGALLSASADEVSFSVATRDSGGTERIYILKLAGSWQADARNRLRFSVERKDRPSDVLTFQGAWSINKKNEIVYTHADTRLKTKQKTADKVTFKGHWDVTGKDRLSYVLNKGTGSQFDFRVSFERALKKGLRFSLGIGAAPLKKRMTLSGGWKMGGGLGLAFEADCSGKGLSGINLFAHYPLLKNEGEAFLKALASGKEAYIGAGAGFRF